MRRILHLYLRASQVKVLPKALEEQIWEVGVLLALQNEVQRSHSSSLIESIHDLAQLCIITYLEVMDHCLLFELVTLRVLLRLGFCVLVKKGCSLT